MFDSCADRRRTRTSNKLCVAILKLFEVLSCHPEVVAVVVGQVQLMHVASAAACQHLLKSGLTSQIESM